MLSNFDSNQSLILQCDASETGLGAAIQQQGRPVAFASRALTDTETRYAQVQIELLLSYLDLKGSTSTHIWT